MSIVREGETPNNPRRPKAPQALEEPTASSGRAGFRLLGTTFFREGPSRGLAVCVFLLLAVIFVLRQTTAFGFINLDDQDYVCNNEYVNEGFFSGGSPLGVYHIGCVQLAFLRVAFAF